MNLEDLRNDIALKQKKGIAVYLCFGCYMVVDINCNDVGFTTR